MLPSDSVYVITLLDIAGAKQSDILTNMSHDQQVLPILDDAQATPEDTGPINHMVPKLGLLEAAFWE